MPPPISVVPRRTRFPYLVALACFLTVLANAVPPARLLRTGYRSDAAPTPAVRFVSNTILELETEHVPGTPVRYLFVKPGKRYWDAATNQQVYGDILEDDELGITMDFDPATNRILKSNGNTLVVLDLTLESPAATIQLDTNIQQAFFDQSGDNIVVFGINFPQYPTLLVEIESGETIWQVDSGQYSNKLYSRRNDRCIEFRETTFGESKMLTRQASTGELLGEVIEDSEFIRRYTPISFSERTQAPSLLAIGTNSSSSTVLNTTTGSSFVVPEVLGDRNFTIALSPDGNSYAQKSYPSGTLLIRDANTGTLIADISEARSQLGMSSDTVWFGYDADGSSLLVTDATGNLSEWNAVTANLIQNTTTDPSLARAMDATPDRKKIFTASENEPSLQIWNIETGEPGATLPFRKQLRGMHFNPSGDRVAMLEIGGAIRIYDTASETLENVLPDEQGLAFASTNATDRESVFTYYFNGLVEERDQDTFEVLHSHEIDKWISSFLSVDQKAGAGLLVDSERNTILYDPVTQTDLWTFDQLTVVEIAAVKSNEASTTIALAGAASENGSIVYRLYVFDISNEAPIANIELETLPTRLALSDSGSTLAYSSFNDDYYNPLSKVTLLALNSEQDAINLELNQDVDTLRFSEDGAYLHVLWHGSDSKLRLSEYRTQDAALLRDLDFVSEPVLERSRPFGSLFMFPDESRAIVATAQNELLIIDVASGVQIASGIARADTTAYNSSEVLRFVTFAGNGSHFRYQGAQGIIDSWTVASLVPAPISAQLINGEPNAIVELESGYEYLLEKSHNLTDWESIELKVESTETPSTYAEELISESNEPVFLKAYRHETDSPETD